MAITTLEPEKAAIGHRLLGAIRKELERRSPAEVAEAAGHLLRFNKWSTYYQDEGPLRRELYPRHLEFFRAGREHNERAQISANRTGKNESACYEITCHMTGIYPKWWEGFRFQRRSRWWICGRTWKEVRDLNQSQLLGEAESEDAHGTGMIPKHLIHKVVPNPHIKFGLESFQVRHVSGTIATAHFKVYEQGVEAFEGAKLDGGIWLDELCPQEIYAACKMRTANTDGGQDNGLIILTFTPMQGLTELVLALKERATNKDQLGW